MVEVHPAAEDRADDVAEMLGNQACRCLYYRLSASDYSRTGIDERSAMLGDLVRRSPAPGMVGYLDGKPVGWCGIGPRSQFARLQRSRTIPVLDDRPVWSVVWPAEGLAGEVAPLHVHHADDEAWHVVSGALRFWFADEEVTAGAGSTVLVPAGVAHTFGNAGPEPSRYIIILPARLDELISMLHEADRAEHAAI